MSAHSRNLKTFCLSRKHNLSLDPEFRFSHLPCMKIGERIARARANRGWSQRKLADEINAEQTTISSWERSRTEPSREYVERVATALGISVAELEVGANADGITTVPVVGYVQAGAEAVLFSSGQGPFDYVPAPEGSTEKTVAVEIRGESLGPFFSEWLVFYDDVRSPITSDLFGKLCVVGLTDGRILVKQIKPSRSEGLFHLMSQTEPPILDAELFWAAKVKGMSPR